MISLDQLVSPTTGVIGQITGILTRKRYNYAPVFVDHYSGLGYVYLQKKATADETIQADKAFEAHFKKYGVAAVRAYHAYNGISITQKWVSERRNN